MKTILRCLIALVVFLLSSNGRAQGYIAPNGVMFFGNTNGLGYETHVIQNPTNFGYTGFVLDPTGRTPPTAPYVNTYLFGSFLDEGVRVFLVSSNDPISLQPIMASSYPELTYPNTYVFQNGIPFYLGFYTGATYPQNGIYNDPLFGWGQFVNNQGAIQFLGGGLEYQGGGIYAGTMNIIPLAVPEPSTISLFICGASALFVFHRWRRGKSASP